MENKSIDLELFLTCLNDKIRILITSDSCTVNMRSIISRFAYTAILMILLFAIHAAHAERLPPHCRQDPALAQRLSRMGPILGLGSSVSHGLMARSFSEVIAEQLCLGNTGKEHAFPWFLPVSYRRITRHYYKSMKPKLVLALDITYHKMKILEDMDVKKKELERLVSILALDCTK
jgi:hypothetical protein